MVFDVETTSRDAKQGEIVEIGAVKVQGGAIVDRWSTLVQPSRSIVGAQLHGLTRRGRRERARPPATRRDSCSTGRVTRCSSATTSASTSTSCMPRSPTARASSRVATSTPLALAREAYPDADVYKLADLARFFELGVEPTHRALPDAETAAALLIRLATDLPARINAFKAAVADSIRIAREAGATRLRPIARSTLAKAASGLSKSLTGLLHKKVVRELVLAEGIRMDGRDLDTIRPISVEVGLLPRAHGSALFTRGQTQALSVATLGPSSDVQRIDTISPEESKRYLHHYNMPPYSTGENKQMRGPGRREIGHGALAERALMPVLPSQEEFPYVIRRRDRVRHLQRLDLDGIHLRLDAGADGRGRAHQGPGRRRRDGPRHRGRPVRGPDRHPGQGRRDVGVEVWGNAGRKGCGAHGERDTSSGRLVASKRWPVLHWCI